MSTETHPPCPANGPLSDYWQKKVSDLVSLPAPDLSEPEMERHRLYCLLLMAILAWYWNGNKFGMDGSYPWRDKQKRTKGGYVGGDYLGHNIACLAVDAKGEVIDFDFNHNEILNSSVEHAESRLIRRIFSLAQINNGWATRDIAKHAPQVPYSNLLCDVTIYTSLESCSQCSGIMALGAVRRVVFLQRDPAQFSVGNILRNLSPANSNYRPPLPIPANFVGLPHFDELNQRYDDYLRTVRDRPFYVSDSGWRNQSETVTSFLCTDSALEVFQEGQAEFNQLESVEYPDFAPVGKDGKVADETKSNKDVLEHARKFLYYATNDARRGTPHKL